MPNCRLLSYFPYPIDSYPPPPKCGCAPEQEGQGGRTAASLGRYQLWLSVEPSPRSLPINSRASGHQQLKWGTSPTPSDPSSWRTQRTSSRLSSTAVLAGREQLKSKRTQRQQNLSRIKITSTGEAGQEKSDLPKPVTDSVRKSGTFRVIKSFTGTQS